MTFKMFVCDCNDLKAVRSKMRANRWKVFINPKGKEIKLKCWRCKKTYRIDYVYFRQESKKITFSFAGICIVKPMHCQK